METSKKDNNVVNPVDNANVLSKLMFWWLTPFLIKGSKKELDVDDLYPVPEADKTEHLGDQLQKEWEKELEKLSRNEKGYLWKALFRCSGFEFLLLGIFCFIEECGLHVVQPVCLGGLIQYFQEESTVSRTEAFLYATGMVLSSFIFPFTHHPYFFGVLHVGMKLRVACCSLVYRKALRLNQSALGHTTIGQMVNLLSNDVSRFDQSVIFLHYLWVGPLQVVLIVCILWSRLHTACLVGVSILLLLIPLQSYMGHIFGRLRLRTAKVTDKRIQLMNEVLSGIRVIKMYTWEQPFAKLVDGIRRQEVKILTKTSFVRALNMAIFSVSSKFILLLTFLTMILEDNTLTAENVFMTVALYNNIRLVMTLFFPFGISQGAETIVSINRLQKFLLLEEKLPSAIKYDGRNVDNSFKHRIIMKDVHASWGENAFGIKNISFTLNSKELLAVIGPVGSGKTSLLMAILNELAIKQGNFVLNGTVAYACQEPWIFQGSVRSNILMGKKYDKSRYRDVIKASALDKDLFLLPNGDMTQIGDKGSTLSGGQKARISLARALYIDADIYLLDDPLSAVDASVGAHLFKKCIETYLKDKACILVTHQVQFLKRSNCTILVLNEGECIASGTYRQLANADLDFVFARQESTSSEFDLRLSATSLHSLVERSLSTPSLKDSASGELQWNDKEVGDGVYQTGVQEETRSHGDLGLKLYWQYFNAGTNWFYLCLLFSITVISEILFCASDYWLTVWTKSEQLKNPSNLLTTNSSGNSSLSESNLENDNTNLYIYAILVGAMFVFVLCRCAMFFYSCLRSSIALHNSMFHTIILVPMSFFEKNPVGRILNRFSKDIGVIDELLPPCLDDCIDIGFRLIGIIILVAMVNYWIIIPSVILAIMFHCLRKFYLYTARDIKRLEGITRSPVFSHLSSTLQGLSTIRAFQAEDLFRHQFETFQDQHSSAWFLFLCTGRWLGIWLDWMCNVYIAIVTYSLLFATDVMGGDVGLAITSALLLSGMCQWGVRQSAEAENLMISVERVIEYSKLEPTEPVDSDKKPPPNWPSYGIITFEHVYVKYSPYAKPVLRNLYFCIRASEKVGVVGRTGAGKSSLLSALFRLVDHDGEIRIDGVMIKELGLHDLRKKLSVIPQDPILFMGTMRYNLDPFDEHLDEELWAVLEDVQLKDPISDLPGRLDSELHEGGANLSVGQRQLVCLARAILRKNKILVLDEATANVDQTTDSFIQKTIRQKFSLCTVITVAHRLNTIMDSDRVMVLDDGKIVEFDEPNVLLQDDTSKFSGLVEMTGKSSAKHLRAMANAAYVARTAEKIEEDEAKATGNAPLVEAESLADEEHTYI